MCLNPAKSVKSDETLHACVLGTEHYRITSTNGGRNKDKLLINHVHATKTPQQCLNPIRHSAVLH